MTRHSVGTYNTSWNSQTIRSQSVYLAWFASLMVFGNVSFLPNLLMHAISSPLRSRECFETRLRKNTHRSCLIVFKLEFPINP